MSQEKNHDLRGPILLLASAAFCHAGAIAGQNVGPHVSYRPGSEVGIYQLCGLIIGLVGCMFLVGPVRELLREHSSRKNRTDR